MVNVIHLDGKLAEYDGFDVYRDENGDLVIHVDMDSRLCDSKRGKTEHVTDIQWKKVNNADQIVGLSIGVYVYK